MADNYIPTITMSLNAYEVLKQRIQLLETEGVIKSSMVDENTYLRDKVKDYERTIMNKNLKITELKNDNERLMREVESLQVQHRNDQGLD